MAAEPDRLCGAAPPPPLLLRVLQDALEEIQISLGRADWALRRLDALEEQHRRAPSPHPPVEAEGPNPRSTHPARGSPPGTPTPPDETARGNTPPPPRSQGDILADVGDRELRRRVAGFLGCQRFARHQRPCHPCKRATLAFLHDWDRRHRGGTDPGSGCHCEECRLHGRLSAAGLAVCADA